MLVKKIHGAIYNLSDLKIIASEGMNLMAVILRSSEEPVLSRDQMHRLACAQGAYDLQEE
jgi:hypothetical protein